MKSSLRTICLLVLAGIFLKGCIFNPEVKPPDGGSGEYFPPTSPENLIKNLAEAYSRKEIEPYARILGSDFIFKFQDVDVQDIGLDTWNRDQDSTGTAALFGTPLVGTINIDLIHGPSEVSTETFDTVVGEVRFIRINPTFLDVDQIGGEKAGTTYRVDGDIQDMFFRRGNAAANEDTTRWFLFEWRDLPDPSGTSAAPGALQTASADGQGAVQTLSWGEMLHRISEGAKSEN
jgi:hypothetical protein